MRVRAALAVSYTPVSDDEFVAHAVGQGMPEPVARYLAGFFADVRDDQLGQTSTDLATLLGRPPVSLADDPAELFTQVRRPGGSGRWRSR